jgi:hypothetical protein
MGKYRRLDLKEMGTLKEDLALLIYPKIVTFMFILKAKALPVKMYHQELITSSAILNMQDVLG